jgi:heme-degrading monooxygenase HmoA
MIWRVWHGWTTHQNADAYEDYLRNELLPRVKRELTTRGYRGFHLLQAERGAEVEFVTMLAFESLDSVKGFAGEDYTSAVISDKAKSLLSRHDEQVEHYQVVGAESGVPND